MPVPIDFSCGIFVVNDAMLSNDQIIISNELRKIMKTFKQDTHRPGRDSNWSIHQLNQLAQFLLDYHLLCRDYLENYVIWNVTTFSLVELQHRSCKHH
jgi:hypothetical protein